MQVLFLIFLNGYILTVNGCESKTVYLDRTANDLNYSQRSGRA